MITLFECSYILFLNKDTTEFIKCLKKILVLLYM